MEYNLADLFDAVSAAVPDRECLVWRDRRLTYAQVAERTNRLANHLVAAGLGAHTERDALHGHESCLWIPAGGFAAQQERALVRDAILVAPQEPAE